MIHSIDPSLAVWLGPLDWSNIMRLAIVIPCQDLHDIELVTGFDQGFPAFGVEVLV